MSFLDALIMSGGWFNGVHLWIMFGLVGWVVYSLTKD